MLMQRRHPGPETPEGRLKRNLSTVLEIGRHEALPNEVPGKRGYLLSRVYSHLCLGGPVSTRGISSHYLPASRGRPEL